MNYETEQGADYGESERLDADLKPWLRREWGLDVFVDEFPYYQYAGQDFDPEDDEKCRDWLAKDWTGDDPADIYDSIARKGPFRTDVVGVNVDRRALRARIRRLGHAESMNGHGQTKRRRRRTYLTFVGDGPMTREYWEQDHGGDGELQSYGKSSASRAFGWLKKRGFLKRQGNSPRWDALDIPLHIHGRAHAFELKLARGEWDTALKQAARADSFADYRWVVYDRDTADRALANADAFRSEGVGLITVHPEDGVDVHVWSEQCTPDVDRDLLDRYNVERWDLNERVLTYLNSAHDVVTDPDRDLSEWYPGRPDILGTLAPEDIPRDPNPPTVNSRRTGAGGGGAEPSPEDTDHKPLTAFAGDGDE